MNQPPLRKLNRRLIHVCLLASVLIAVPLIVISMARSGKSTEDAESKGGLQAFTGSIDDAFAISGTEHFPKNYAAIHEFERQHVQPKVEADADPYIKVFEKLASLEKKAPREDDSRQDFAHHDAEENPWGEARKAEQKRRAFDHYDARRSHIMFVNNNAANKGASNSDPAMDAIKRSLDIAEKQMNQDMERDDMFFSRNGTDSLRGPVGKIKEALSHMVSEGTLIPAILLSEIDTSLPGPILARVSQNIWDSKSGQTLLIPQNSQIIGEYDSSIGHGQTRAQIVWKRIIFPNQQSINLGSMVGVDKKGTSGTAGSVDNHYDKVALGLILTTALGGSVRMAQGKYDPNTASIGQEFGNSLAQESARLGNKITDKMLSIKPTIKVPMGKRLNIFVEQDLSLQPYAG